MQWFLLIQIAPNNQKTPQKRIVFWGGDFQIEVITMGCQMNQADSERMEGAPGPVFFFGKIYGGFLKLGWLVVWNMNFICPYIGNSNPNWLIVFRGVETTNQQKLGYSGTVR